MAETAGGYTVAEYAASDGYRWRYRRYTPTGTPLAHVICIHGIQSHGGWYEHSCGRLRDAGFSVSFLDRRGAGMNERDRGDTPGFRRLLDDIAEFRRVLVDELPVFLVAISWGGKLAVALERRNPGVTDGLALLCPGFFPRVRPKLAERLAILGARLVRPRKLFDVPLNDPALFTASPSWQQFIAEDPLGLRRATARFLVESVRLDAYLRFVPRYVHVPVLVLLAEKDRIIDNARTREYVERFATADKQVVQYPEAHHTLEFEPEPEVFIRDLIRWLEEQTRKRQAQGKQ